MIIEYMITRLAFEREVAHFEREVAYFSRAFICQPFLWKRCTPTNKRSVEGEKGMPAGKASKTAKVAAKGEKKGGLSVGMAKSGLLKSQIMTRSIVESRGRLHAPSRRFKDGDGDDDMDEAWLAPKTLVKPDDQLTLTEKELKEEITRVLTADNPHAPDNIIRFNFKENTFKHVPHIDHFAMHFSLEGNLLHKDSDEAQRQQAVDGGDDEEDEEVEEDEGLGEEGEKPSGEGEGEGGAQDAPVAEGDSEGKAEGKKKKGQEKKLKNQFNYSERASQTYNYPLRERGTMTEPPPRANFSATANQMEIYDCYVEDLAKQAKEKEKKGSKPGKDEDKPNLKKSAGELPVNDDITRVSRAAKIMERMVNQNTFDDIAQDFKYYDDPSDEFQDTKGTLLPLWKFTYDKAKRMSVTTMCWNPKYPDLFAVGRGGHDFGEQSKGLICFHSLKNPTYPELVYPLDSGIMCLDIHEEQPALVAVGLYDGSVAVFDLESKTKAPIYQSTAKTGKHLDPVWQVAWQPNDMDNNINFYSVSSDSRVVCWTIVKSELLHQDVAQLTIEGEAVNGPDGLQTPAMSAGTCFDFNKTKQHLYLVGTEEGRIYKCSKAFSGHFLEVLQGHHLAVYSLKWSPFHPNVFASCGADWSVKVWDHELQKPMFTFDLSSVVCDVAWAPFASTVFAACTADGKIHVFDLNVSKYEPLCVQSVIQKKKTKLTHIAFNPSYPVLIVGDDRGSVSTLKLSPNLRKALKEKTYSRANEVAKLEKLMKFVREPLLDKDK